MFLKKAESSAERIEDMQYEMEALKETNTLLRAQLAETQKSLVDRESYLKRQLELHREAEDIAKR